MSPCTVVCILSTVRKAARFAVNVASMRTTKSQYAATKTRPERDLGASPPPCGVKDVKANLKGGLYKKLYIPLMKSKKKYLPEALFDGEDPEWVGMRLLVVLG